MVNKEQQTLGSMIAAARKAVPWSLQQLGETLGKLRPGGKPVSPQFLNDVEHDRRNPSEEMLQDLAKVLRLDVDVLRAVSGASIPPVSDYLRKQPELGPEVGRVFRKARERGFTNWERIRKIIEED